MSAKIFTYIGTLILTVFLTGSICAQTSSFTFQGKLNDGGLAANNTYQFEFKLYDAASGGNQIGATLTNLPATVTNGIFSLNLDFGANAFDGAARYLEIGVRLNGIGQPYTTLNPRQPVTSTPYAVKSLKSEQANTANTANTANDAAKLGNVPAANYTQTNDARLSDARTPTPFSPNYIQNGSAPQAASDFNISGEGKANILTAATQFNIGANRVLSSAGSGNLFVGVNTGTETTGTGNSFVGRNAGQKNTTGNLNSFFGSNTGQNNTAGFRNSFFGVNAGTSNISGNENSFFGLNSGFTNSTGNSNAFFGTYSGFTNSAGNNNAFFGTNSGRLTTEGSFNAFFGRSSGESNTTGGDNAFLGQAAGLFNTEGNQNTAAGSGAGISNSTGSRNTFVGYLAGQSNTTENGNTFLGYASNGTAGITNATAIGAYAVVTQSNTMVLGTNAVTVFAPGTLSGASINATSNYKIGGNRVFHLTGTDNVFVGVDAGNAVTGSVNAFFGKEAGKSTTTGFNNTFAGSYAGRDNITGGNNSFFGANAGLSNKANFNSFFGSAAGISNLNGASNSFFGTQSGENNLNGQNNSFFGRSAGNSVTTGSNNTFIGALTGAGSVNGTGSNNTAVGYNNKFGAGVNNSVIIGSNLQVTASDTLMIGGADDFVKLGRINSNSLTTGSGSFGEGVSVNQTLTVAGNFKGSTINTTARIKSDTRLEAPEVFTDYLLTSSAQMNGVTQIGFLKVPALYKPDNDFLCVTESDRQVVPCYAITFRQKNDYKILGGGLNIIRNLQAVTFNADGNTQDVALISSGGITGGLFVKRAADGVETVRYKQVITALVSAAQEQDAQNQKLQDQVKRQQTQLDALKAIVCAANQTAAVCQPN